MQRAEDMGETRVTDRSGEVRPWHIAGKVVFPGDSGDSNSRVKAHVNSGKDPVGFILERGLSLNSPTQPTLAVVLNSKFRSMLGGGGRL